MISKRLTTFLVTLTTLIMAVDAQDAETFLKNFTAGAYHAKTPAAMHHMNDGQHYTTLSPDGKSIVAYEYTDGKASDTIFCTDRMPKCTLKHISGYEFSQDEKRLLIHTECKMIYRRSFTTEYYVVDLENNHFEPLSEKGPQQMAQFSPNGHMIAFARDNNLFIKKLDFGTELQITKDGEKNHIINGTPDWVYEEEFAKTRYFEWSTDNKLLAFLRFDESAVQEFSFQQMNDTYPTLYTYKYPKAGTANSTVSLHVYDIANRTTKDMQIGTGDFYLPLLRWTNDANTMVVAKLNRSQTELKLIAVNARSTTKTTLFIEADKKAYSNYELLNCLHFYSDNSFVCMSNRDGWCHLYLFRPNGQLQRQLTKGAWDVTDFYGYDEKTQTTYFQAAKETPTERHIYKANAKGKITNLDNRSGMHSASFSKNFKYAMSMFNNCTTPNIYAIINNNGKPLRIVEDNQALADTVAALHLPQKEFFTFTTPQGTQLNGWIVKPAHMQNDTRYPLVMVQYSGPNSQEVLNRWAPDWEYYLAQEGYIVACVDPRGTGARGRAFSIDTYKILGQHETEDQVSAAKYLSSQSYIDPERIAIWGWSYGGFMAINCMINGNGVFKTGIAVAPVTSWLLYNTAYTERFMNRPQENSQGYQASNLIEQASQLQGNLLIVHGTADDNVHLQNTLLMADALTKAGKPFEMHLYTNKNHSILGADTRLHLYRRFNDFLKKNV